MVDAACFIRAAMLGTNRLYTNFAIFFEMYKDFPVREAIFSLRFRPYFSHELNGLNNSIVMVNGLFGGNYKRDNS